MALTYLILFHIFIQNSFVSNASIEAGLQVILANLNQDDFTSTAIQAEKARISNLFYKMKSKWTAIRVQEKFETKHKDWLETEFVLPAIFHIGPAITGRPKLDFSQKGERAKQLETKPLREENSTEKLLNASLTSLKTSNEQWHHDLHFIMKQCLDDHSMATKYRKFSDLVASEEIPSKKIVLPQPLSSTDSMVYFS